MTQALGMIEVIGFPVAIEAADAALKAAQVKLLGVAKVGSGIVTVLILGDIGAIQASVDAGAEAARRIGKVRTQHVIARTEESILSTLILPPSKSSQEALEPIESVEKTTEQDVLDENVVDKASMGTQYTNNESTEESSVVEVLTDIEQVNKESFSNNNIEDMEPISTPISLIEDISVTEPMIDDIEKQIPHNIIETEETLKKLSTTKLKELLVQKGVNLSSKKLKSAKKQELIQMILDKTIQLKGEA